MCWKQSCLGSTKRKYVYIYEKKKIFFDHALLQENCQISKTKNVSCQVKKIVTALYLKLIVAESFLVQYGQLSNLRISIVLHQFIMWKRIPHNRLNVRQKFPFSVTCLEYQNRIKQINSQ